MDLSQPPSSTAPSIGMRAQELLHLHREKVAVEHGGGLHHHLADRQGRQLHRIAACLPDAALHRLRAVAQMRVAGAQVAPGVEDRDDRLAEKLLAAQAHLLRALAMREAAHVVGGEPALAPQFPDRSACHLDNPYPLMPPEVRPDTTRSWKITIRTATGTMPTTSAAEITGQGNANSP